MSNRETRQELFQTLLAKHEGILFRVVNTYARQPEDQQDLFQEMRVQLWRAFPRYDSQRAFSTWAYRVALNTAISWFRRRNNATVYADLDGFESPQPPEVGEKAHVLTNLIDQLDPLDRAILTLYLDDVPQNEIAEIVGTTPGNIATKISRIKARLRAQFEQKEN